VSRLDEIRARLEAATPGPWYAESFAGIFSAAERLREVDESGSLVADDPLCVVGDCINTDSDTEFIAHAPEDIAWLLKVAEAALDLGTGCEDPNW
jgi:hypothetical protein